MVSSGVQKPFLNFSNRQFLHQTADVFAYKICKLGPTRLGCMDCSLMDQWAPRWFQNFNSTIFYRPSYLLVQLATEKTNPVESTRFSVCFRGIGGLRPAFIFLRWFKLTHIYTQVCALHDRCKQGYDQQNFDRKSTSRKTYASQIGIQIEQTEDA